MIARVRGRDGRAQLVRIGVVVAQADVHEDRHQAVLHDRRHGAGEAGGHGDDLVAGLEAPLAELGRGERRQGHQVRRRAGVDEQGVREAEVVGDARLELLGEAAGGEVEVEAGVDQVAQLLLAEHAAGVAHRVAVGVERRRRVALPVVPAHQLEDLAAGGRRVVPRVRHVLDPSLVRLRPRAGPRRGRRPGRPAADPRPARGPSQGPGSTRGTTRPSGAPPSARPRPAPSRAARAPWRLSRLSRWASWGCAARSGRRGPRARAPLLQEALDHPAHRTRRRPGRRARSSTAPRNASAVAQHEGRQPEIARRAARGRAARAGRHRGSGRRRARRRPGRARSPG